MFDPLIIEIDKALRTLFFVPKALGAQVHRCDEPVLSVSEKTHSGALMRVNHVGEVCAQALYQGQALACRDRKIRLALGKAAADETEHLAWTTQRIHELGARKSLLNPLWYLGAFGIGGVAGRLGDAWSLGFLAETERQVEAHLGNHLIALPEGDTKSRAIVRQMKADEHSHAETAVSLGAKEMPMAVKVAMRLAAGVMTRTAYHL